MKLILDNIIAYLATKLTLYSSPVFLDMFPTITDDGIMVRVDPGQPVEQRYLNGSRTGQFNFTFYARSLDSGKAYNQLCDIQTALDICGLSLTDVTQVTVVPTSNPSLVQRTEAGQFTYTAGFRLDYFSRR